MNKRDGDGAAATGTDFPRPASNCDWGLADVLARDVEMGLGKGSTEPSGSRMETARREARRVRARTTLSTCRGGSVEMDLPQRVEARTRRWGQAQSSGSTSDPQVKYRRIDEEPIEIGSPSWATAGLQFK